MKRCPPAAPSSADAGIGSAAALTPLPAAAPAERGGDRGYPSAGGREAPPPRPASYQRGGGLDVHVERPRAAASIAASP